MKKQKVLDIVNELPQEFDLEELIERLILIEKIENGLEQLDEGNSKSHIEVKKYLESMRSNSDSAPCLEEITEITEQVRSERYGKK